MAHEATLKKPKHEQRELPEVEDIAHYVDQLVLSKPGSWLEVGDWLNGAMPLPEAGRPHSIVVTNQLLAAIKTLGFHYLDLDDHTITNE